MPVSATTFDQRSASVLMKAANSAGVLAAGIEPGRVGLGLDRGIGQHLRHLAAGALSTIAGGVPFGATSPSQTVI